ncbi:MAG TPA: phage holin family protein [Vitreimonas sp.]|nr:phage holin family protein [Vitreimonas sp.]
MIASLLINMLAIGVAAYLVPGVYVDGILSAFWIVVVLGLVNTFIRPILKLLTFPINFVTLGLFSLVINAALVMLVAAIVPGFDLDGFLAALFFSIVTGATASVLGIFKS